MHCSAGIGFLQTSGTSVNSEGQESKTGTSIFSDLNSNDKARTKIKTNNLFWRRQDKQKPVCVMVNKECGSHEAVLSSGQSYHKLNLL